MAGQKFFRNLSGTMTELAAVQTSAGAGDAGKIAALDAAGRFDSSMMPTGIGADTASIATSENLASGDLVNVYNVAGTATARKADATTDKRAHGFVLAASTSPAAAVVYFEGTNTGVTGLTPGDLYLSTTPGLATSTAPSAAGNIVQHIGIATSATSMNFEASRPFVLA